MTQFNKGPVYGLTAELRSKIAGKYDLQKEEELRFWIEEVTGMPIGENFQKGLKDGVILCELINKLQPGSIKKINHSKLNWHKLENLGNFIRAILKFGLCPNDIFEANDLFENGNMTQVQSTLLSLAGVAKTKGSNSNCDLGVKYADKRTRHFDEEKMKAGQCVIGLQVSHANTIAITTVSRSLYGGREEDQGAANTDFVTLSLTMQQAKTKGSNSNCVTSVVKYADKGRAHFDEEKMKAGQCVIGLQAPVCHATALLPRVTGEVGLRGGGAVLGVVDLPAQAVAAHSLLDATLLVPICQEMVERLLSVLPTSGRRCHGGYPAPTCQPGGERGRGSGCRTEGERRDGGQGERREGGREWEWREEERGTGGAEGEKAGMSAPGTRRDIYDQKSAGQTADSSTISLQMGTNKVASQKGMSSYGLGRQIYDPKYCTSPTEPTSPVTLGNNAGSHGNGSLGTGTNGSEISDSDYQAEYQYHHDDEEEYRGGYQQQYSGHYDEDQGIDY
ncbi:calponin-3-like [Salvelinus sp. IW2-2015]|uniref:calponin-3-like n=1 Tax=Salvelinus sp. IW2-2015 TaxID=2691554 RepID=UPI0038D3F7EB